MADDAVTSGEMRWLTSPSDPIDAVLRGESLDEDLLDAAAIVHDLRSAYLPQEPLRLRPDLAAFTDGRLTGNDAGALAARVAAPRTAGVAPSTDPDLGGGHVGGDIHVEPTRGKRTKMLTTVAGFVGTLTGKVALGATVAAASAGGLHAADVVSVPGLPQGERPAVEEPADRGGSGPSGAPADQGAAGQATADERQAAATSYAAAVQEWSDCVAEAAASQGDAEARGAGRFDPRDHCGERPTPQAYGLTELPNQASDTARSRVPDGAPGAGNRHDTPAPGTGPEGAGSGSPANATDRPAPNGGPAAPGADTPAPVDPGSGSPASPDTDRPGPGVGASTASGPNPPPHGKPGPPHHTAGCPRNTSAARPPRRADPQGRVPRR